MGTVAEQFFSPRIDVLKPLVDAQVQAYVRDGFLVVPNVFTRAEREELFADMVKLLRGGYECPLISMIRP